MNICFYTDQRISGMTGGIGRVTEVLAKHFSQAFVMKIYSIYGREPSVMPPLSLRNASEVTCNDFIQSSICLRLHDRMGLRPDVRRNIDKAVEFINSNHIDVMIIQTSMDVAAKLHGRINARMISVLHFEPGQDEWPWKGILAPLRNYFNHRATVKAYRTAYQYCEKVLVLSESYIPMYAKYAGLQETSRLMALPNPLSFSKEDVEVKAEKKHVALVVARMEDTQKRISNILRIWFKVQGSRFKDLTPSENPLKPSETSEALKPSETWTLKIVGDGPSLESYKQLAKELKLTNVEFTGRQDPIPYYREASIFLMASSFEGFPMTLVEAQQFGCVPIAYDSFAALKDVITNGRNGIIVKDLDEEAYANALKNLMSNPTELERLSQNARQDCQRFNIKKIGSQWQEIILKFSNS